MRSSEFWIRSLRRMISYEFRLSGYCACLDTFSWPGALSNLWQAAAIQESHGR